MSFSQYWAAKEPGVPGKTSYFVFITFVVSMLLVFVTCIFWLKSNVVVYWFYSLYQEFDEAFYVTVLQSMIVVSYCLVVFIAISMIIFIVLGFCGFRTALFALTQCFYAVAVICFILTVLSSVWAFLKRSGYMKTTIYEEEIIVRLYMYNASDPDSYVDDLHRMFKCCGWRNATYYQFWLNPPQGRLPGSCCTDSDICNLKSPDLHMRGCKTGIKSVVETVFAALAVMFLILFCQMMFASAVTLFYARSQHYETFWGEDEETPTPEEDEMWVDERDSEVIL